MDTNSIQSAEGQAAVAAIGDIRHISTEQLAQLGLQQIAYVKPVMVNGTAAFAIHAADGTPMAIADDRDVAIAAIQQHEMVATQVH
ncbi:MAG TPA: DUF1150 family protein [Acetobacteraceae bacterium]|jgi:hypothetical protein|nr:DUF1150 family protein [Acetobacteraceae bacterium]